ncbi:bestrophin-2-like isoform X2 [Limulus polyphemus]|uniref:Bestrophin homolog n=1 Tax=Limulus polyphemus TaxID=6850 RepID=A0ABM1S344_LIMPO|nr:bestrophin-2-like isoform X2 [Limulus polyphemus]
MTVTYSLDVADARLLGFAKLLFKWRGSIYKLLYREIIIFCVTYFILTLLYRCILTEEQKMISMLISAYVHGNDERGRIIRRSLVRYLSLLSVLTFQTLSTAVKKRFPSLDHLEEAGLMTKEERQAYEDIPGSHGKWWVPAQWFTSLVVRARREGRIKDDILLKTLLDELHVYRGNCGMLYSYDWISVPLVYTQVVTLAIYTYFLACVMGRQYLDLSKGYSGHKIDLYVPIFTILQFFFYMGWLKVAESLINPFGDDDDDFELNWCLDRNLVVSTLIVDEMFQRHPLLVKDQYWDELEPQLPHTKSSITVRTQPYLGSTANLDVHPEESEFVPMETILEEDNSENAYTSVPNSPENEPLTPGGEDSVFQRGGMRFPEFPGSKLLNFLIGQSSSENVAQTPKREVNFPTSFLLKTPRQRSRTESGSDISGSRKFIEQEKKKSRSRLSLSSKKDVNNEESLCLMENASYEPNIYVSCASDPLKTQQGDEKTEFVDKICSKDSIIKSSQSTLETKIDINPTPNSTSVDELSFYEPHSLLSNKESSDTSSGNKEQQSIQLPSSESSEKEIQSPTKNVFDDLPTDFQPCTSSASEHPSLRDSDLPFTTDHSSGCSPEVGKSSPN